MKSLSKLSKLLFAFTLMSLLFAQITQAESKKSLVSLGDSITFGWNLQDKNTHPSKDAFPNLVAVEENYRIRNLGVGGATSADLLALLGTEQYQQAVRHADLITLDIGSNDFLKGARPIIEKLLSTPGYQPTQEDLALIAGITKQFGVNLAAIIEQIRSLTDAPILLYTIYNPFYGMDAPAGAMLSGANQIIAAYGKSPSILIADAFTAFAGKQNTLILPGDVHPNLEGQEVLASLAISALDSLK